MLGERLKASRIARRESRTALAAAVGVSESTACRWERGTSIPNAEMLSRLADALGCSTDHLLGRDGEEE
jgi:putative transcriptional regulator